MSEDNIFKNNKEINAIYKKYGDVFVKTLTSELVKAGKKASGRLIKSIRADLKPLADAINIVITGENYLKWVDEGRKKGTYPNIDAIKKWVTLKSIPQTAVFPIAKNIYKFGIKPTNVISKSTNIFNNRYLKVLEKDLASVVEKEVAKRLKRK